VGADKSTLDGKALETAIRWMPDAWLALMAAARPWAF
jgi:hypothetical protein